ncbi:lactase-phlorizin hydrolase-like isoform X2 [Pieris brassicae]|uniref:lactase-phlorizin hydrolase-like isoform X2 n=1 Tax=Pieris brassicae TaxID=7116 RepID=UPI001E65EE7D|nr:lactase-phlorizin hydrolase-like isoform X2 [Pieris brassicae]
MKTCIMLSVLLLSHLCTAKFPPWFKFGAATSSYQIEGAWNISDKTPSIWDTFCHIKYDVKCSNTNGDVAANSYYQWEEDIAACAALGLDYYRFSISWTRILPTGYPNKISKDGVRYYNELINGLLAKGIEPMVTMYHWELPQNLQDLGGWTNALIGTWFADYAKVLFSLFGDRVKTWLTINEPLIMCAAAYGENTGFAPGISDPNYGAFLCAKNTLLAHARAWRIYDVMFKPKHRGKVSIANQIFWLEGKSEEERKLGELTYSLNVIYTYPVFSKNGGWPEEIEEIIATNSKNEGFSFSRLPPFTTEEINFVKGTYDFFGLNYYTSRVVRKATMDDRLEWPFTGSQELGSFLTVDATWRNENIVPWLYVELAIKAGINVTGYTVWSLIDTFEWESGNTVKFGLYKVDYDDPKRARIPRPSAKFYAAVIQTRSCDVLHTYINDEL